MNINYIIHPLGLAVRDVLQPNLQTVRFTVIEPRNFNTKIEVPREEVSKYTVTKEQIREYTDTFSSEESWFLMRVQRLIKAQRQREREKAVGGQIQKKGGKCQLH